jgi:two-component system chemotaxis response regulator CheY
MNSGMKILVVDDSSLMRNFAKGSLQTLKLNNVTEAGDGVEALAELKKGKYDLILSDLQMPNMDGLELLKAVRSDIGLKNIPFIIMTLAGKREVLLDAVKEGLNDYLMKPVTARALDKKLKNIFR